MKSTKYTTPIIFLCFLCFAPNLLAQKIEKGLEIRALWLAKDEVNDLFATPVYPAETFKGLQVGQTNIEIQVGQSFQLFTQTKLTIGLTYEMLVFQYQNWNSNISTDERPKSLYALNLPIECMQNLGNEWYFQAQSRLGLASDLKEGVQSDDVLWQGFALVGKTFGTVKNLRVGVGVAYSTILGTKRWLPALDFYWQTGKIRWEGLFPFQGGIYWTTSDKFEVGIAGRVRGNRYNLNYVEDSPAQSVEFNHTSGGLNVRWKPISSLVLNIMGGININRTYEVHNELNKKIADFDTSKLQSPFVEIGLHWKWKQEKVIQN